MTRLHRFSSALALLIVCLVAGTASAASAPIEQSASYLAAHQLPDGGFAEQGGRTGAGLTSWVVLALAAAGRDPAGLRTGGNSPVDSLRTQKPESTTDLELKIVALAAMGADVSADVADLEKLRRPSGQIGPYVNSTIWGVLALRAAGRPAGSATVRYLLRAQRPNGGWAWHPKGSPDSNDTAAAIQALRATGLKPTATAIRHGLAFLRTFKNKDGGYGLGRGDDSDSQSTAWAIQALVSARAAPGKAPFRFLARMRRADDSYRYSARYTATPVWVTAQVVMALERQPLVVPD